MGSPKQKMVAGVFNQEKNEVEQEIKYDFPAMYKTLWGRAISVLVTVSYLMMSVGQSLAMEVDNSLPHERQRESWIPSFFSNSVVPVGNSTNSDVLGDVELGRGGFQGNNGTSLTQSDSVKSLNEDGSPKSVAKKEDEILNAQKTRILHVTDVRKVHPSLDLEQGNLQGSVDEKEDDNQSDISEEEDEATRERRTEILKEADAFLKETIREETTLTDFAVASFSFAAALILIAGYKFDGWGEIQGEVRLWVDSDLGIYALTEEGYRFMYMSSRGETVKSEMTNFMTINNYVALTPYVFSRASKFVKYMYDSIAGLSGNNKNESLNTKIHPLFRTVGVLGASVAALVAGGSVASVLYSANISFLNTRVYAEELTPYVFAFYTADAFLRYSLYKDNKLNDIFVGRSDDIDAKKARDEIITKLKKSQAVINSMSDDELRAIDLKKVPAGIIESPQRLIGIDALQNVIDVSKKDTSKMRRFSVKTRENVYTSEHQFNFRHFIEKRWPIVLGLMLAVSGVYLSYFGSKSNIDNAMQMQFPKHFGVPDFHAMGGRSYQQLAITGYHVWQEDTKDITVYDGSGNDWCTKCRKAAKYTSGNIEEGGDFFFADGKCPGVGSNEKPYSVPGDWDYTEEKCDIWFNVINNFLANSAGVSVHINGTDDDYYVVPPFPSLAITPTENGISTVLAVILTTVSGIYAASAVSEAINRVKDSLSNERTEILPGKRNKLFNAVTLSMSGIQSLIRATPIGVGAWYYLQDQEVNPGLLWLVVSGTSLCSALNYFNDFDDIYARIPNSVRKIYGLTKNRFLKMVGVEIDDKKDTHVICDTLIEQINQIIDKIQNARKEVVIELKNSLA